MSVQNSPQLAANLSSEQYNNLKNVIKIEEQITQYNVRLEVLKKQYSEAISKIQPVLVSSIVPPSLI